MKKRAISIILSIVMLVSLLPTAAWADGGPLKIGTAAELAALGGTQLNSTDVVLTADIDMQGQEMSPIAKLYGATFDGGGHTISNLSLEAAGNTGLFAELSGRARITDLTLENCTVTQTGGSYSGAGLLVGKVSAAGSRIEASGAVGGSVTCTGSSASYIGGLVGYDASGVTLSSCFSTAAVTAGSNYSCRTGGILGSAAGGTVLENCYARGALSAGSGNAGGLVGYGYGSYSSHALIRNSYAAVDVSGSGTRCYPLCYAYNYTDFENCYYDSERTFNSENTEEGVTAQSGEALKASAAALGGAFQADLTPPVNEGYPILKWQDPAAVYSYTLTVEPADALVTWNGAPQEARPDGVYTFPGLLSGSTHTYEVAQGKDSDDYASQAGTVTIGKADGAGSISLEANRYSLTFTISPETAELTVKDAQNETLQPAEGRTFSVVNGTYTYTASLFGHQTASGSVTIDRSGHDETVTLTPNPAQTVTFQYGDLVNGPVENASLTVTCGEETMAPDESGLAFSLPLGYRYAYTFKSANYAKVTDTIDLTGEAPDHQTIVLPMAPKTAWGGADDIQKPTGEGTESAPYEIGTGAELAWLAREVTAGRERGSVSVLTKDIDLGDEPWTPIGTTGWSSTFTGTLDGAGHTIKNLFLDTTSSGQGLFACIDGGRVSDLTLEGTVRGGDQTGALAGEVKGSAVLEGCMNRAGVTGGNNAGGLVGKISGASPTIRECVNRGSVTANNSAGGIAGYLYYGCTLDSCYNTGSVEAVVSKAGGIAGYCNDSNASIAHCYTTGPVTAPQNSCALVGMKTSGKVDKASCFYPEGLPADSSATETSETVLKDAAFPASLGAAFQKDMESPINDGFPILKWQDTTPKYTVTLTLPANAALSVTDAENTPVNAESADAGVYTFSLTDGTYQYTVSGFGYLTRTGSFTVSGAAVNEDLTPRSAPRQTLTFRVTPEDAAARAVITLHWGERLLEPTADPAVYSLPDGTYTYTVKAKGYAKLTGSITLSGADRVLALPMEISTGWDGESREAVTPTGGVYELSDGAELAWFCDQVNAGPGRSWDARLSADINLNEAPWTPIGSSSNAFAGTFDGAGHTIQGLNVAGAGSYSGLFGLVSGTDAAIRNLIVDGTVSGGSYVGGIVGQLNDGTVENCGNLAAVSGSGSWTGGVVGRTYGSNETIRGCYNAGTVTGGAGSGACAGGILGKDQGWQPSIRDCYNIGTISCGGAAGGIIGNKIDTVENCYNTGTVIGADGKAFAVVGGTSGSFPTCYYLSDSTPDPKATAKTAEELQALTSVLNAASPETWKQVPGVNQNFPILSWQKDTPAVPEKLPLPKVPGVRWAADAQGGLTTTAVWEGVENAASYTVVLWKYAPVQEGIFEPGNGDSGEGGGDVILTYRMTPAAVREGITETSVDFAAEMASGGTAAYCVTVTPIAAADSPYLSGTVPQDEAQLKELQLLNILGDGVLYTYTAQLPAPANLRFIGTRASWDEVPLADGYQVILYKLDEDGNGTVAASGSVGAEEISLDCRSYFTIGSRYAFTVTALSHEEGKDSEPSPLSSDPANKGHENGIYTVTAPPESEPGEEVDHTGWIAISSAQQWVELANVEDVPVRQPDGTYLSRQSIEWSKNYYLTADLDFSRLSAAEQAKSKSLGTVNSPFTGTFDGSGFAFRGLTLSGRDSGLFAYLGGTGLVENLTVTDANVQFSDNAAVLAYSNKGTIRNCAVVHANISADTGAVLGGMVSRNYGVISDSFVSGGSLTSHTDSATGHAGFVGANEESGLIERCWSSMDVSTESSYAGGFVGLGYGGTIRDCFALGDVSARDYSGGFAGRSVYSGNRYENCYAAGTVTVTGPEGHGFIAPSKPDSAFHPDVSREVVNCYCNAAAPADTFAQARTLPQMQSPRFLKELNGSGNAWVQVTGENNGLPILRDVPAPEDPPAVSITAEIAVAAYDKDAYCFVPMGTSVSVTMDSNGNTRVIDLMDAAVEQGLLTYSYDTSPSFGRFIHTINGRAVSAPDGWMFTLDDQLSSVSASLATVTDGTKLLWFEGTTENHFQGPTWAQLENDSLQWIDISDIAQLRALAESQDDAVLSKNYRLTADLDLAGEAFPGIGSASHPFTGRFDGGGHTISSAVIQGTDSVGFFRVLSGAEITGLNLSGLRVSGVRNVGGLAGSALAAVDPDDPAASTACLIGSCTVSGTVSGLETVGGLVGCNGGDFDPQTYFSSYSTVDKCTAAVAVNAPDSAAAKIGGLVGRNDGAITKSAATGSVNAPEGAMVGGLVGENGQDIYDSHSEGNVTGSTGVGGFAGISTGSVKRCYSLGRVSGRDNTASFAGSLSAADTVLGAGTVKQRPGGTSGYVAGLAGQLNGTLSGAQARITVKNAFGNCVQSGAPLKAVGNTVAFPSEADKALLETMALTGGKAVSDKLMELFGVRLEVPSVPSGPVGPVPAPEEPETAPVLTPDSNGAARLELSARDVEALIADAAQEGLDTIQISPRMQGEASKIIVALPKEALTLLAAETAPALLLDTAPAELTLPRKALAALAAQTRDSAAVSITFPRADGTTQVEIAADGAPLSALEGGLLLSLSAASAAPGTVPVLTDGNTVVKKSALVEGCMKLLLPGSASVQLEDRSETFRDTRGHWAADAISAVSARDLFVGVGAETFAPERSMSRAMIATVLWRLEGEAAAQGANSFDDVAPGQWYTEAVRWAAEQEIVEGSKGRFAPDAPVTRQELAVMLYRYAGRLGLDTASAGTLAAFPDSAEVSDWAADALAWAVSSGLVRGGSDGLLNPAGNATRAEVATLFVRMTALLVQ